MDGNGEGERVAIHKRIFLDIGGEVVGLRFCQTLGIS